MERSRVRLDLRTRPDDRPVFVQGGHRPVFRGVGQPEGLDFVCGSCGNSVLAENVLPRQLWNVAFYCFRCGQSSATARRPPGTPLGRNVDTPLPRTRVVIAQRPIELPGGLVYASPACARARAEELRALAAPLLNNPIRTLEGVDTLHAMLRRVRDTFGDLIDTATHLEGNRRRRGRAERHRLRFLAERVRASAETFPDVIDLPAILELDLILELAHAWQGDPAWPSRLKSFREAGQFTHGIIELAAGSALIAIGNDVGPERPRKGRRTADLGCVISAADVLALEIKVPQRLQWPARSQLRRDEAVTLVERALGAAGTGRRGQLSPERPGILVIGGFHLALDDVAILRDAALACFTADHAHVAAVMVVSLTMHSGGLQRGDLVEVPAGSRMGLAIVHLVALNRGYIGPIGLRARDTPWLHHVPEFGEQRQILPEGWCSSGG